MEKKLYRSRTDKKICGVCAGLGKYLNMDVSILRLFVVLISLFTGVVMGLLVYLVCALVLPEEPENIIEEASTEVE